MLRRMSILCLACCAFVVLQARAHEGHDHDEDLTEQQVAQLAAKTLPAVIKTKKLSSMWSKAERQDITVEPVKGKTIWVVSYKNPDGTADGGQALFLFFDELGNYLDANRSGDAPSK